MSLLSKTLVILNSSGNYSGKKRCVSFTIFEDSRQFVGEVSDYLQPKVDVVFVTTELVIDTN